MSYAAKYAHLREPLETIAREHPVYGYRRTTAELREAYGYKINHKVVQGVHQEWDLPLIRGTRLPKPSGIRRVIAAAGGGTPANIDANDVGRELVGQQLLIGSSAQNSAG